MSTTIRYKCTLKPGITIKRGEGVGRGDGFVYLYGDGPWGELGLADLATREIEPLGTTEEGLQDRRATS
jgi:hypothetical protein